MSRKELLEKVRAEQIVGVVREDSADVAEAVADATAVTVWEMQTGGQLLTLRMPSVRHVAFSPNGRLLVGSDDAAVQVWDAGDAARE